jgi:FRG domain
MAASWASHIGEDVEPPTWDECLKMLLSLGGDELLYRGHARFEWNLSSTLERALLENSERFDERKHDLMLSMAADRGTENWAGDVERVLMLRFREQALHFDIPALPPLWDRLGWWEVMQHHGAPTRLMDWTTSPFIGLWFAVDHHNRGDGDMALWVYSRNTASLNLATAMAKVKSTEDYDLLDDRQLQNMLVQIAITGDWTALLIPIRPRQFQRAVAQQSVLTVSPGIAVARPADWWIRERLATRIRIREDWKPEIQAACQSMGLSRAGLFRDLDSLGASILRTL